LTILSISTISKSSAFFSSSLLLSPPVLCGACSFLGRTYSFTTGSSFFGRGGVGVVTGLILEVDGGVDKLFKAFSASATFYLV
jgi:hypothetical protein